MIFELDTNRRGDWDRFQIRNIGFAVQKLTSERFGGDPKNMQSQAFGFIKQILGIEISKDLAVTLLLIPELKSWSSGEKELLTKIAQAKAELDEGEYLRLMQRHLRFRELLLKVGSKAE